MISGVRQIKRAVERTWGDIADRRQQTVLAFATIGRLDARSTFTPANGSTLERAAQMANRASMRMTQLNDRRTGSATLDEVERGRN
jgi:hypothetical protein